MIIKTKGIVFKTIPFSNTSIIVKMFTKELGLKSFIVKGVRTSKAKNKASLFQPLNILEIEAYRRENKNLEFLKEYRLAHVFSSLPFDVVKSCIAIFLLEVLNKVLHEEEQNEPLYQFLEDQIVALDKSVADSNFHLRFLLSLTSYLGFSPDSRNGSDHPHFDLKEGRFMANEPAHGYFIRHQLSRHFSNLLNGNTISISSLERRELLEKILLYYQLHTIGFGGVKSHKILTEVLAD